VSDRIDLDAAEDLHQSTTPGPWRAEHDSCDCDTPCDHAIWIYRIDPLGESVGDWPEADVKFVVEAHRQWPALVAWLRAAGERITVLEAAILRANAALNTLPWAGDGLTSLVHDGHASGPVVNAIHATAGALDAETLGLLGREVPPW
jgi:hypothetical protein